MSPLQLLSASQISEMFDTEAYVFWQLCLIHIFKGKLKLHKVRKRLVEHFSIWWKPDRVPSSFCSLFFPPCVDICFIKAAIEVNLLIKNLSHLTAEQREISNETGCRSHLQARYGTCLLSGRLATL